MPWQERWQQRFYRTNPRWKDGTTEFWDLCRGVIPKNGRILELGAGPTNATSRFLATLGELHGADVDPDVRGNEHLATAALIEGDRLPFGAESFDTCVSNFVMEHVAAPLAHLSEVQRVLRPGGVYVFRTPNRWHYVTLAARATPHWFHELVANRVRGLPPDAHKPYEAYYTLNTRRDIVRWAKELGLRVRTLRMIEKDPSYGMSSRLLYLLFMAYERIVNSTELFAGVRVNILGVLEKP